MNGASRLVVAVLDSTGQVRHVLHGVRLQQVFVVQVVEEDVQATLSIVHLGLERSRRASLDALHVRGENFIDGHGVGRDVGAVPGGCDV